MSIVFRRGAHVHRSGEFVFLKNFQDFGVSFVFSDLLRGFVFETHRRVGSGIQQQLRNFRTIVLHQRIHQQRCNAEELRALLRIDGVYIRTAIQQKLDNVWLMFACPMKRLASVTVEFIGFNLGPGVKQHGCDGRVPVVARPVKRSIAQPATLVNGKRIKVNVRANDLCPTRTSRQMNCYAQILRTMRLLRNVVEEVIDDVLGVWPILAIPIAVGNENCRVAVHGI